MNTIIAGPCVIEHSAQWLVDQAGRVKEIVQKHCPSAELIFKASFDKANRSTLDGARGIGVQEGLEALADVRKIYGIRVTTDVHTPQQAYRAAAYGLVIQIPAMLARQTDLIRSAALSGARTTIKVPVWADAAEAGAIRDKFIAAGGAERPWLIYRGTQHGPGKANLKINWGVLEGCTEWCPTLLDMTHTNHGNWLESVAAAVWARAGAYDLRGAFMETHPAPAQAWCDGKHQLDYEQFAGIVANLAPKISGG